MERGNTYPQMGRWLAAAAAVAALASCTEGTQDTDSTTNRDTTEATCINNPATTNSNETTLAPATQEIADKLALDRLIAENAKTIATSFEANLTPYKLSVEIYPREQVTEVVYVRAQSNPDGSHDVYIATLSFPTIDCDLAAKTPSSIEVGIEHLEGTPDEPRANTVLQIGFTVPDPDSVVHPELENGHISCMTFDVLTGATEDLLEGNSLSMYSHQPYAYSQLEPDDATQGIPTLFTHFQEAMQRSTPPSFNEITSQLKADCEAIRLSSHKVQ